MILLSNRFVVKEGIKLDDAVNVCKRDLQSFRNFRRDLLRKPAVNFLRGMEGRKQTRTTEGNEFFEGRNEVGKVNFGHGRSNTPSIDGIERLTRKL